MASITMQPANVADNDSMSGVTFGPEKVDIWLRTELDVIQDHLHLYAPPILVTIGLLGNTLALCVLSKKSMMQCSTTFYMAALVVSNVVALFVVCAADWIARVSHLMPIHVLSDSSCRIWYFIIGVVMHYPTWLITAMTIDRFVCVWSPQRSHRICTTFRAKVISIFIFIGLMCVSIHAMWSYALYTKNTVACHHGVMNHYFHSTIWPWIQAALCSYTPLVLQAIFCSFLLFGTIRNGSQVRVLPELNKTVLFMSITYFLLASPLAITNLVEHLMPPSAKSNNVRAAVYLTRAVSHICLCANYTLAVFWLVASSKTFRKELMTSIRTIFNKLRGMQQVPTTDINGDGVKIEIEDSVVTTPL